MTDSVVSVRILTVIAGWSSLVAREAHNLEVVGSNPTPATKIIVSEAGVLFFYYFYILIYHFDF